jgi:hypothetical protein
MLKYLKDGMVGKIQPPYYFQVITGRIHFAIGGEWPG